MIGCSSASSRQQLLYLTYGYVMALGNSVCWLTSGIVLKLDSCLAVGPSFGLRVLLVLFANLALVFPRSYSKPEPNQYVLHVTF